MGEGEVKFWRANLGREGWRAREKKKKKGLTEQRGATNLTQLRLVPRFSARQWFRS